MAVELAGKTVAVVGGCRRMLEIILQARAVGAVVKAYGCAPGAEEVAGLRMRTLGGDDALAILHAVPSAEGVPQVAIEHTEGTVLGCPTLCFGMAHVGMSVAKIFKAVQANVTLGAGHPSQLTRAWAADLRTLQVADLPDRVGEFTLIGNSASGMVLTPPVLKRTRDDVVIIDLCSTPGSVDFPVSRYHDMRIVEEEWVA